MSPSKRRPGSASLSGVRLRLPELLKEHNVTPWKLAKMTDTPPSTLYRLARTQGRLSFVSGHLIEAIARVLNVGIADVLELERTGRRVRRVRAKRQYGK